MVPKQNRLSAVSGRFYPNNPSDLKQLLHQYFYEVNNTHSFESIQAIISPHAGYIYSGKVAASTYSKIYPRTNYKNVFILAPSHYSSFEGASIYNIGNYETPLGEIPVNIPLANSLIKKSDFFKFHCSAHKHEHSIEVQLPFLQYWFKNPFKLVPVLLGQNNHESLLQLAHELTPYFIPENLFVISSDFSHFPNSTDAQIADGIMAESILQKSAQQVIEAKNRIKKMKLLGLETSACGLNPILILMYLIENNPSLTIQQIMYQNSGDALHGNKDSVVGYLSFIIKTYE